jgi:hypothetical protein
MSSFVFSLVKVSGLFGRTYRSNFHHRRKNQAKSQKVEGRRGADQITCKKWVLDELWAISSLNWHNTTAA